MTAAMKEHLADERIWTIAARVAVHDGESTHYEINGEGQIQVSVITLRHGVPINAILTGGDGSGNGSWKIPSVGTEVMLTCDDGQFEGDVFISGFAGKPPANIAQNETQIVDDTVYIGQKTGAQKMVKGETYRSAEDTLINAMTAAFAAINVYAVAIKPIADPSNLFTPALTTALTTAWVSAVSAFQAAATTYLASKGKVF